MKTLPILFMTVGLATGAVTSSYAASNPDPKHVLLPSAPRTVVITEADTPPVIRTGLLQATLIELPAEEKVATVFGGDTVSWVFDGGHVASRYISIKPKVANSTTTFISSPITATSTLCSFARSRRTAIRTSIPRSS